MRNVRYLVSLLALVALGCGGGMEIETNADPLASFDDYKTWAFQPGLPTTTGDPRLDNTRVVGYVRSAVERELAARGFEQPASGEDPDFFVNHHMALDDKMDVGTVNNYYRYPYYSGYPGVWSYGGQQVTHVQEYSMGSLVLDILDGETKQMVWRGYAQAKVSRQDANDGDGSKINEAVRKMLQDFPPR